MRRRKNSRAPTLMCVAVTAFLCLPHTAMAESGKLSAAEQLSAETAEAAAEQSTAETGLRQPAHQGIRLSAGWDPAGS